MDKINVIVTAGGRSQRYGVKNKLFEPCGTSCVLIEAIKPFLETEGVSRVIVSIEPSFADEFLTLLAIPHLDEDPRIKLTVGGSTRTESVKHGLSILEEDCDYVIVHDGARPYVSRDIIQKVIEGAKECGASLPLLELTEALVSVKKDLVPKDRKDFRLVQTPACFETERLVRAYSKAKKSFYDDISVVQKYTEGEVKIVDGDPKNAKITTVNDLKVPRTGCGYDIHRLKQGDGVVLLGEKIPCEFCAIAHSDGDAPVHAVMDAILTAIGEKDIGHFFPVDAPEFDGADSMGLLSKVIATAKAKGFSPVNASVTIIAEKPYIAPHIDKMRANLARALSLTPDRIGISATTNEKVGDIGAGNAIAAYASVLLI